MMKTSKKKSLSRLNTNGSIIYVKNESNCFFVAIYFGILYLQLQTNQALRLNKSDTSQNHKKYLDEMNEALYTTILPRASMRQHSLDLISFDLFRFVLWLSMERNCGRFNCTTLRLPWVRSLCCISKEFA